MVSKFLEVLLKKNIRYSDFCLSWENSGENFDLTVKEDTGFYTFIKVFACGMKNNKAEVLEAIDECKEKFYKILHNFSEYAGIPILVDEESQACTYQISLRFKNDDLECSMSSQCDGICQFKEKSIETSKYLRYSKVENVLVTIGTKVSKQILDCWLI